MVKVHSSDKTVTVEQLIGWLQQLPQDHIVQAQTYTGKRLDIMAAKVVDLSQQGRNSYVLLGSDADFEICDPEMFV